jgi:ATP-dependent DNA helicase RecG
VFDEFLLLQLALGQRRERLRRSPAPPLHLPSGGAADLMGMLGGLLKR